MKVKVTCSECRADLTDAKPHVKGCSHENDKKWLILHVNGGRVASVELTQEHMKHFQNHFNMSLIQRDYDGSEHWNVIGINKVK